LEAGAQGFNDQAFCSGSDAARPEFSSGDETLTTHCPLQLTDKGPGTHI